MHHLVHPRVWAVEEIASINQFTQKLELLREADIPKHSASLLCIEKELVVINS
jgi:hypothetical protein